MQRPLGAQISRMLKERGVEVIFGIPGVHNIELYRGIEQAGITHVLARHEQGAGFMADGYARASGKPGVAYVITGPGLCNIMTPMGQAYSDSVPMLVISSCLDEVANRRGQLHQMLDQEGAAACVCDWSETAHTATAAYGLVDRAFVEFQTRRARPKHIQVPIAVLGADAPEPPAPLCVPEQFDEAKAAAAAVAGALERARSPLIVLGGGAGKGHLPGDGAPESVIRAVLDKTRAASMCSFAGRGLAAPDDPLHYGPCLAKAGSIKGLAEADLVLFLGTDLAEVDLWREHAGHKARAIIVNIDTEVLAATGAPGDALYQCSALPLMDAVAGLLEQTTSDWRAEDVATATAAFRAETDAARPGIVAIVDALAAGLPDDTMIYSDMTQFAYVAKEVWPMRRPDHWHHPFGFGTLGYALPAAIGGAVARPDMPTLAIAGDYGFQYTLQELGVAVELGLSLPILIWDNAKLGEIEDAMVASQIAPNAVVAQNPDFLALARAYGADAVEPGTLAELVEAVNIAFGAGRPTIIRMTRALKRFAFMSRHNMNSKRP